MHPALFSFPFEHLGNELRLVESQRGDGAQPCRHAGWLCPQYRRKRTESLTGVFQGSCRVNQEVVMSYERIYPCISDSCLVANVAVPDEWKQDWDAASAESWR